MEFEYDKAHTKKPNKTSGDHHGDGSPNYQHPTPSSSELLASAKIVANAAKAQLHHDQNYKFDKGELAGAAESLLHAASNYGKLDEKGGLGKMVGQAEGYLHKYHSSQTTTATNPDHSTTTTNTTTTQTIHTEPPKDEHGHSGGGYGEYIKMAEGLLNKHSGSGEGGQSGGKYGDYIKMAEGMLKKQSGSDSSEGQHGHHSGSGGGGGGGYGDYIKMAEDFLKK